MDYRRAYRKGGCYFFTVVTHNREPILTLSENVNRLRDAFEQVGRKRKFSIDAIVILPDHLHCIWEMPEGDGDFSIRWRLIKHYFSVGCVGVRGTASLSRRAKNEKVVWQRRFWEHMIRDEHDWHKHMDYIHFNPVKHGYVKSPKDWCHGSFRKLVRKGLYTVDWGHTEPDTIRKMYLE